MFFHDQNYSVFVLAAPVETTVYPEEETSSEAEVSEDSEAAETPWRLELFVYFECIFV